MGNIWTQFEELLPQKKQLIGQVNSINSTDKTCTVTILNGGSFIVKGSNVTVGSYYIIENGEIIREVPDLPVYSIVI